jgi:DNA polymerase-3 subunit delta
MSTYFQKQFLAEAKSGVVHKIYYLYGNDTEMVLKTTNILLSCILGKEYDQYIQKYDASNISFDMNGFSDQIQMYPFGCQYNCIVINDYNCEKRKADENKKILEILKNDLNETSVVVFYATGFDVCDGKNKPTAKNKKLIDYIEKNGAVVVCNIKTEAELSKDIIAYVKKKKCTISNANAVNIAQYCLCQTSFVYNELDKLCAYVSEGEITSEVINKLVVRQENMKIYALANSIQMLNTAQAVRNYHILAEEMETEQILYSLTDTFMTWYRARTGTLSNVTASQMQSDFDYRFSFIVTNAFRECRKFTVSALRKSIIILRDTQKKINSTSKIDKNIVLEQAIISVMRTMK